MTSTSSQYALLKTSVLLEMQFALTMADAFQLHYFKFRIISYLILLVQINVILHKKNSIFRKNSLQHSCFKKFSLLLHFQL